MPVSPSTFSTADGGVGRRPLSVALIGAGGHGETHLQVLLQLEAEGLVRLAAVTDPRMEALSQSPFYAQLSERSFSCHNEMLRKVEPEAVWIGAPPHVHTMIVKDVISRGQRAPAVYLEKPPVPTLRQLRDLIEETRAARVAVGFQFLESLALQKLKSQIVEGRFGSLRRIVAAGATNRGDAYYSRSSWAGKLQLNGLPVFDGPATNGLSHLVHNVFFLSGTKAFSEFARPREVAARFLRARNLESYDFAYLEGSTPERVELRAAVAHCTSEWVPWVIRVEGTEGTAELRQADLEREGETARHLLEKCCRAHLPFLAGASERPSTSLSDCLGYMEFVSGGLQASQGVQDFPSGMVHPVTRDGEQYFVAEAAIELIRRLQTSEPDSAVCACESWLRIPDRIPGEGILDIEDLLCASVPSHS